MRISELAARAKVTSQTIRFYEREGLMPKPVRTANGYREYDRRDLERVLVIRSSRDLGFTVDDIRELLELHRVLASREGAAVPKLAAQEKMLEAADRRLASIEDKLRVLEQMKKELLSLVGTLKGREKPVCPVSGMQVT
jgi:MerR family transcriptional regulator, copper efflux regulator